MGLLLTLLIVLIDVATGEVDAARAVLMGATRLLGL